MTEAERLQKILTAQEKELRRLRRLLSVVTIAHVEYGVQDNIIEVTVSAIGVDEYHFIDKCRLELERVANVIIGERTKIKGPITDSVTGEEAIGAVMPK